MKQWNLIIRNLQLTDQARKGHTEGVIKWLYLSCWGPWVKSNIDVEHWQYRNKLSSAIIFPHSIWSRKLWPKLWLEMETESRVAAVQCSVLLSSPVEVYFLLKARLVKYLYSIYMDLSENFQSGKLIINSSRNDMTGNLESSIKKVYYWFAKKSLTFLQSFFFSCKFWLFNEMWETSARILFIPLLMDGNKK